MKTLKVELTLKDDTKLLFDAKREEYGYISLRVDGDLKYTLAPSYNLYKKVGNVLCAEEVPYKELSIKITNNK